MINPTIIIPAHNEAASLGRTLQALPKECRPVIAVNGSTDATEEVAREFGAEVYVFEAAGKDAAFRGTLERLGDRALEPFIITDADTVPLRPRRWQVEMVGAVNRTNATGSVAIAGLLGYRPEWATLPSSVPTAVRTAQLLRRQIALASHGLYYPSGANAAFRLDARTRDALVESPERYWPGEDQYYFDLVKQMGGVVRQHVHPYSLVLASSRRHTSLLRRMVGGRECVQRQVVADYALRGRTQAGVVEYRSHLYDQMVGIR